MRWHDGSWNPAAWVAMGLVMIAFWGAIVAAVVIAARAFRNPGAPVAPPPPRDDAFQILDERFARGEIDADDYQQRRDLLRKG